MSDRAVDIIAGILVAGAIVLLGGLSLAPHIFMWPAIAVAVITGLLAFADCIFFEDESDNPYCIKPGPKPKDGPMR